MAFEAAARGLAIESFDDPSEYGVEYMSLRRGAPVHIFFNEGEDKLGWLPYEYRVLHHTANEHYLSGQSLAIASR